MMSGNISLARLTGSMIIMLLMLPVNADAQKHEREQKESVCVSGHWRSSEMNLTISMQKQYADRSRSWKRQSAGTCCPASCMNLKAM